ncbi:MAG: hypothetical protein R3C19_10125 [Planctomycetaceae bacterium]
MHTGHVYLCRKMEQAPDDKFAHILVHELFHFVDDENYLRIRDPGYREKVFKLTHKQRMANADSYALLASHAHFGRERLLVSQPTLRPHIPAHLR